jgi:DbpA-like RNA binding protein
LTTEDRVTAADAKAALERGRPVVLVRPPAVEQARDLWELLGPTSAGQRSVAGPSVLLVCADDGCAAEWSAAAPADARIHAVTGLGRTSRVLKERPADIVAGAVKDLAALVERTALKLAAVTSVVLAWPESLVGGEGAGALDTLLGEARDAHRIVLSWNPALLGDFLERHARRALVVGTPPVDQAGRPLPPVCRARYAIVPSFRRSLAVRDALDTLCATTPFIWNGGPIAEPAGRPDAVCCTALPSRDEAAALARLGDLIVFIAAAQLPYLRSVATLTPLTLGSGADRARDRAEALRERVAQLLTAGSVDAELALLDPLFQRFDPAEVAGALLALQRETGNGKREEAVVESADVGRVKVFVNVGKKDRASAKDLVAALIREAGVPKGDIGRIEVRESFSLVDVAAGASERAVRGLAGVTIRGRRVLARLDRDR